MVGKETMTPAPRSSRLPIVDDDHGYAYVDDRTPSSTSRSWRTTAAAREATPPASGPADVAERGGSDAAAFE